ncbi:MAG: 4Fe-4S binding protein [Candidatus Heimdallarchaeaceae archaeon]
MAKEAPDEFERWVKEKWGSSKLPEGGVVPYPSAYGYKTCISCMNCFYYCPDSAIIMDAEMKSTCDNDFCKGCGICAKNCPADAIDIKRVTR